MREIVQKADGSLHLHIEGFSGAESALLPLADETSTLSLVAADRCLEFLSEEGRLAFFAEAFRVLAPGGRLRVSTPDLLVLVRSYVEGRVDGYADLGAPASSPAELLNRLMRANGRIFLYDEPELTTDLMEAGFKEIRRLELEDERELTVEATR